MCDNDVFTMAMATKLKYLNILNALTWYKNINVNKYNVI